MILNASSLFVNAFDPHNFLFSTVLQTFTDVQMREMDGDAMWIDVEDIPKQCVFCDRQIITRYGKKQKTTKAESDTKKINILEILRSSTLHHKADEMKNAKYINYHLTCFAQRENKLLKNSSSKNISTVHQVKEVYRGIHSEIFSQVKSHVNDTVIEKSEVRPLSDIFMMYSALFDEAKLRNNCDSYETSFKPQHLLKNLLHCFPDLSKTVYKNRIFLHRKDLTMEELLAKGFQTQEDLTTRIKSVAFEIRKKVLGMNKRNLPKQNLKLKDITEGEIDIPEDLFLLIESLLNGPRGSVKSIKQTKIQSICSSIIFSMSNGSIKPATCISLGLVTKSITGSRKMLDILNRLGHCISYTVTEELETELAYGCSMENNILPYGLVAQSPNHRTHLAFDNYDKYVETSSGKDTLHDTVGIVYQNITDAGMDIPPTTTFNTENNNRSDEEQQSRRRRKYFSTFDSSIDAYVRKNRQVACLVGKELIVPENLLMAGHFSNLWAFHHIFNTDNAKRWFAWNSERIVDQNPVQRIGYLPNINMSPTSDAVVQKTLQVALQVAEECEQNYIIVTYDLAIASKAYRIQSDMAPDFDKVFITLGAFHIQLSFFKVCVLL